MILSDSSRRALLATDVAKGLRGAIATVVPLYFSLSRHSRSIAWIALAGWLGSLADPGGTRGRRARVLLGFVVLGALLVMLGETSARSLLFASIVLSAVGFSASLFRALGGDAASLGTMLLVATSIATSNRTGAPLFDGALFACGGLWALALSSVLWPIWTHLPVRRAVAAAFLSLQQFARDLSACAADHPAPGDPRWAELARSTHRRVRGAIEEARRVALSMRSRNVGESRLGSNVRALLGSAEASFFLLIALADEIEARENPRDAALDPSFPARLAQIYGEVHDRLYARNPATVRESGTEPPVASTRGTPSPLAKRLVEAARTAQSLSRQIADLPAIDASAVRMTPLFQWRDVERALATMRDALAFESPIFRHAVRVACTVAAALPLARAVSPEHVPWVMVTAVAVLQPYPGVTVKRAIERVIGTGIGCLLTVALMAKVHEPWELAAVIFPLSVSAIVTRSRNYRLFTLFLTPVFVLFVDAGRGDSWTAAARAGDVALGGAVAFAASALVFPSWEKRRLKDALSVVLATASRYVASTFDLLAFDRASELETRVVSDRRRAGVALNEAEASLERLLSEPRESKERAADAMQLITYARRLTSALTTIDVQTSTYGPISDDVRSDVARFRVWVTAVLEAMSAHLDGKPPRLVPDPPDLPPMTGTYLDASLARILGYAELIASLLPSGAPRPATDRAPIPHVSPGR